MKTAQFVFKQMNAWAVERKPFVFLLDYKKEKGEIFSLEEMSDEIQFQINETHSKRSPSFPLQLQKFPMEFSEYHKQFQQLNLEFDQNQLEVINLTVETPIKINWDLQQIYEQAKAKYKVLWKDRWVCFSPETFVQIRQNKIHAYPMKGTINASLHNAENLILTHPKEIEEHQMTVDLVKEELEEVAENVSVLRFRYIDRIATSQGGLLQVSSEIVGDLKQDFHQNLGDLFDALLPATSICGAPKNIALDAIEKIEQHNRNFYTGIFGVFDGENVDSAVLIRMIEQKENQLVFKSGGGVTAKSEAKAEYEEMMEKIYVPM